MTAQVFAESLAQAVGFAGIFMVLALCALVIHHVGRR